MERLLLKHSSGGLEIIALNLVDPIEKIKAFIKSNPTTLSVAFDADKSFSVSRRKFAGDNASYFVTNKNAEAIYEIPQFPTSYLIDQQGMVVGFFQERQTGTQNTWTDFVRQCWTLTVHELLERKRIFNLTLDRASVWLLRRPQ